MIPIKIEYGYWYCINLLHCLTHLLLKNSMKAKSSIFCFRLIIVKVLCLIFLFEKKTSLTQKVYTTDITKSTPLYDTKGFVKCWSWKSASSPAHCCIKTSRFCSSRFCNSISSKHFLLLGIKVFILTLMEKYFSYSPMWRAIHFCVFEYKTNFRIF